MSVLSHTIPLLPLTQTSAVSQPSEGSHCSNTLSLQPRLFSRTAGRSVDHAPPSPEALSLPSAQRMQPKCRALCDSAQCCYPAWTQITFLSFLFPPGIFVSPSRPSLDATSVPKPLLSLFHCYLLLLSTLTNIGLLYHGSCDIHSVLQFNQASSASFV